MWIAYPVATVEDCDSLGTWTMLDTDYFRSAPAVSKAFAVFGRPGKYHSKTWKLANKSEQILDGYLFTLRGIGTIAILKFPTAAPATLVKPNQNSTAMLLNQLGLVASANLVTQTIVSCAKTKDSKSLRFNAEPISSDEYIADELYPRLIAAVAIERMSLDLAVEKLNSEFVSARQARKLIANIKFWNSRPSLENPSIRRTFHAIRDELELDARTTEILGALEEIRNRGNIAFIAGSATTAGLLSITDSQSLAFTQSYLWVILSVFCGILAWAAARGFRY